MTLFQDPLVALAALAGSAGDMQGDRLLRLRFPQGDAPADVLMVPIPSMPAKACRATFPMWWKCCPTAPRLRSPA